MEPVYGLHRVCEELLDLAHEPREVDRGGVVPRRQGDPLGTPQRLVVGNLALSAVAMARLIEPSCRTLVS